MYKMAFLFNGIGSEPEKLLARLTPEMTKSMKHTETRLSKDSGLIRIWQKILVTMPRLLNGWSPFSATEWYTNTSQKRE